MLNEMQLAELGLDDPKIPAVRPDATAVKKPDPVEDKLKAKDSATMKMLARVATAIYGKRGGLLPGQDDVSHTPGYISAPLGGQLDNAFAAGAQHDQDPERSAQIDQMFSNAQPIDQKAQANHAALAAYLRNRGPR